MKGKISEGSCFGLMCMSKGRHRKGRMVVQLSNFDGEDNARQMLLHTGIGNDQASAGFVKMNCFKQLSIIYTR
jgi:hypothetical protein